MDKFEVTVGRLRRFIDGYPSSWPQQNDGANPHVPGSGWQARWFEEATYFEPKGPQGIRGKEAVLAALHCDFERLDPDPRGHQRFATWTDTPTSTSESVPVNCVTWYTAFAFCAWDGGRLPTEAEYLYVVSGGDEQRPYPWGSAPWDTETAQVSDYPAVRVPYSDMRPLEPVGSRPKGASRWGQLDLLGSLTEPLLDSAPSDAQPVPFDFVVPCNDCVDTRTGPDGLDLRRRELGAFLSSLTYYKTYPSPRGAAGRVTSGWEGGGVRCVRDP